MNNINELLNNFKNTFFFYPKKEIENTPNIEYRSGCETISTNGQTDDTGTLFTGDKRFFGHSVAGYGDCATWAGATYAGATCEDAGTSDCEVLVSAEFAMGMCSFLGETLTTSETCSDWADSFSDEWLDANAAAGVLPGMPTAGYTCTQYGGAIEGACIAEVSTGNDMYVIDPAN